MSILFKLDIKIYKTNDNYIFFNDSISFLKEKDICTTISNNFFSILTL